MGSGLICGARAMATANAASSSVVSAADENDLDSCREAHVRARGLRCSYTMAFRGYIAELARAEMQVRTNGYLTRAARRVWQPYALDTVKKLNAKEAVLARALRTTRMDRAAGHKRRAHYRRMRPANKFLYTQLYEWYKELPTGSRSVKSLFYGRLKEWLGCSKDI